MFQNISIGMYYPGHSFLHRLQARTKLLLLLWIAVWLVIANQHEWRFAPFIAVVALLGLGVVLSGISPLEMGRRLWLLILLFIIGALPTFFTVQNDPRPLYTFGPYFLPSVPVRNALFAIGGLLLTLMLALLLPRIVPPLSGIRQQRWYSLLRKMRVLIVLLAIVIVIVLLYLRNSLLGPRLHVGPFVVTYGGTWVVASVFTGLLALYAFSILLTMTTSPIALVEAISLLLHPLRKLRLPVDDFALMVLLALRFIPTLLEEVEQLIKAQMARGGDLTRGTLRERLQSFVALFVPLMQAIFRRADELATALEARGYQVEGKQTMLHETRFGLRDVLAVAFVLLVSIGTLLL